MSNCNKIVTRLQALPDDILLLICQYAFIKTAPKTLALARTCRAWFEMFFGTLPIAANSSSTSQQDNTAANAVNNNNNLQAQDENNTKDPSAACNEEENVSDVSKSSYSTAINNHWKELSVMRWRTLPIHMMKRIKSWRTLYKRRAQAEQDDKKQQTGNKSRLVDVCNLLEFNCPMQFNKMNPVSNDQDMMRQQLSQQVEYTDYDSTAANYYNDFSDFRTRHCSVCNHTVHLVQTPEQLEYHALEGHCIAYRPLELLQRGMRSQHKQLKVDHDSQPQQLKPYRDYMMHAFVFGMHNTSKLIKFLEVGAEVNDWNLKRIRAEFLQSIDAELLAHEKLQTEKAAQSAVTQQKMEEEDLLMPPFGTFVLKSTNFEKVHVCMHEIHTLPNLKPDKYMPRHYDQKPEVIMLVYCIDKAEDTLAYLETIREHYFSGKRILMLGLEPQGEISSSRHFKGSIGNYSDLPSDIQVMVQSIEQKLHCYDYVHLTYVSMSREQDRNEILKAVSSLSYELVHHTKVGKIRSKKPKLCNTM